MNLMLTIQLPADVQAGEYDVVLMNTASNHTTTIVVYERRYQQVRSAYFLDSKCHL